MLRKLAFGGLLLLSTASITPADELEIVADPLPHFDPGQPSLSQFGALTYLGGLALNSRNRDFEALSGLDIIPEAPGSERLIMVTDEGRWITASLMSSEDGAPLRVERACIGAFTDTGGAVLSGKSQADMEAVSVFDDVAMVAAERSQPVRAFRLGGCNLGPPSTLPFGSDAPLEQDRNTGPEAIVHVSEGSLAGQTLIFLEEPKRRGSDEDAVRYTETGERLPFSVRRPDDFAITGADMLPGGDIVIVERRFSWSEGIDMRIRILGAEEIMGGAAEGRVLIEADGTTVIDNMEGIAVTPHGDGPILTVISDDNGNFFQRTVLLRFQITGEPEAITPPAPTPRPEP